MADVGIRNDNGTNVIFHANKKKIEEFERLEYKIERKKVQVVGSPISYTQAQSLDGLVENNISLASAIIPQSPNNNEETYIVPNQNTSNTHFTTQDSISHLSLEEQISLAKENQKTLNAMPKASDIDKDNTQTQDTTQRVETQSQNSIRRK